MRTETLGVSNARYTLGNARPRAAVAAFHQAGRMLEKIIKLHTTLKCYFLKFIFKTL